MTGPAAVREHAAVGAPAAGGTAVDEPRWARFLSFWALGTAAAELALLLVFAVVLLPLENPLADEFLELAWALERPGFVRLVVALDVVVWIGLAGLLLGLGVYFVRRAQVRGTCCSAPITTSVGVVGALARVEGVLGTAQAYAGAAAAEQARTLDSFLDRAAFTTTAFNAGTVFWALGFLLAGWIGLTVAPFPRWLAGAFALLGALALLDLLVYVATDEFVLDVVKFPLLLLVLVASAWGFRRLARRA